MNTIISQALATGLPVVATIHSGLPDQVLDGKNGFLAPEASPDALAEKLIYLIDHPALWAQFGQFGRSHVKDHYDSRKLIDRQIAFYKELISTSRGAKTA